MGVNNTGKDTYTCPRRHTLAAFLLRGRHAVYEHRALESPLFIIPSSSSPLGLRNLEEGSTFRPEANLVGQVLYDTRVSAVLKYPLSQRQTVILCLEEPL
jgi:hypothetical protein